MKNKQDLKNYKSVLFRDGKTLVFKSNNIEKRWDAYIFLDRADAVCSMFHKQFEPQSLEEYQKSLGKNALVLNNFKNNEDKQYKKLKRLKYRGFINKFGISPATFKKVFNAIMREIWCVQPYFNRYCHSKNRIKDENVRKVNKNLDKMDEARAKGFNNIVPFILHSGISLAKLNELFGNTLWNKLINNSHHKNNLVAQRVIHLLDDCGTLLEDPLTVKDFEKKISRKKEDLIDQIEFFNKIPSTILIKAFYLGSSEIEKDTVLSLINCLKIKEFIEEINDTFHLSTKRDKLYSVVYQTITYAKKLNMEHCVEWKEQEWRNKFKEYEHLVFFQENKNLIDETIKNAIMLNLPYSLDWTKQEWEQKSKEYRELAFFQTLKR